MARARIRHNEQPDRVILTYHLPGAWWSLSACFWCLAGGLAVGIGIAVPLSAAGMSAFRPILIAVTLITALLLYLLGYLWALRSRYWRVTFDYARDVLTVEPVYAGRRPVRYAFDEIAAFELVDRSTRWQTGCALTLVRHGVAQPDTLLALPRACDDERTALPHLVTRLEAQLEADPHALEDDVPPFVPPLVPARRWQQDSPDDEYVDQQSAE